MKPELFEMNGVTDMAADYSPGLEGVIAFETEIAEPDKDGGAPARVLPMLEEVERTGDAGKVVRGILDRKERLMGFGHRVYRAEDPRARVLRRTCKELDAPRYQAAEALEQPR
jgi:citrate synthase